VWKRRERAWGRADEADTRVTRPAWTSVRAGGTTGGQRPQRCGTAAGEEEPFEGCDSAGEELALVRGPTARSGGRRDPEKPSEPQVRNRAETCAGPEVGGSRRGGGKPRGRNTKSWCGNHDPRGRCFGAAPGVDDRGERRRRGVRGRIPGEDGSTGPARGHGLPAPHRERCTRSEGEEAARRLGHEPSGALQGETAKLPSATMNGKAGTAKADRAVTGRGRVGDHRDLERQRTERARSSSDGPG
jgi:hypothetical protein